MDSVSHDFFGATGKIPIPCESINIQPATMNTQRKVLTAVLYVGLIPYDWDESVISLVVCGSGKVVEVRVGLDYAGKNKGFCFVEYQTPQDAQFAIPLLSMIKLVLPANPGQPPIVRKLRIDLLKEPFMRNGVMPVLKPLLRLDRSRLPPYVQIPPEMLAGAVAPPQPIAAVDPAIASSMAATALGPTLSMPLRLTSASQSLPKSVPESLNVSDNINASLSKIPPPQLIQLIAQLKNIVGGPDPAQAADILRSTPHNATTAAQALLLMGLVDTDVIQESMKTPAPPVHAPAPPPQQQYNNQQQMAAPPQNFDDRSHHTYAQRQYPPHQHPNPAPPPNPAHPVQNQPLQSPDLWPGLPSSAQAKLRALPVDQAQLIAQVLQLPQDQILNLPADKQTMVMNLRQQYL